MTCNSLGMCECVCICESVGVSGGSICLCVCTCGCVCTHVCVYGVSMVVGAAVCEPVSFS